MMNMNAHSIGIVRDDRYLKHVAGPGHVESPERLQVIYDALDAGHGPGGLIIMEPREATEDELAWNHSRSHIERIRRTSGLNGYYRLDPDTVVCGDSWKAAVLAAGGVFSAMDAVMKGEVAGAVALVRPPGHHAERDQAMGFCLFNNVALGAHYALKKLGLERVLVMDWDLHHGNGTQHSFYDTSSVLYFSTHQYPYYPGSGGLEETGRGEGVGFTVNCPLRPGKNDLDFAAVCNSLLVPVARSFKPDFILVSAGFDIAFQDPLGGMGVTPEGFAYMAGCLKVLADELCEGRIVFCLEGGYSLEALRDGVMAVLNELAGSTILEPDTKRLFATVPDDQPFISSVKSVQSRYWEGLLS